MEPRHTHADDWSSWPIGALMHHVLEEHAGDVVGAPDRDSEWRDAHAYTHRIRCSELLDDGPRTIGGSPLPCGETAVVIVDGRAFCVHHGARHLDVALD